MNVHRVHADTSVIGGCFDEEFAEYSCRLMDMVRRGRLILLISEVVARELAGAPPSVQEVLSTLPPQQVEAVRIDLETIELRDAYLRARVVTPKWIDDATHVAAATVARADAIVSWNFKHIVHLDKIRGYSGVNAQHGYDPLVILSPVEIVRGESVTVPVKKKKQFDCIEYKRRAQAEVYAQIKGLSPQAEIDYFRRAAELSPVAKLFQAKPAKTSRVAPRA